MKVKKIRVSGTSFHEDAIKKAEAEFIIYREREMKQIINDFDSAIKKLTDSDKYNKKSQKDL